MSSPAFRAELKAVLAAGWTRCPVFDLSDWASAEEVPGGIAEPMLLLQFIGGPERIATIGPIDNHGWREDGTAILHLCFPVGESSALALQWGEDLVLMFRGRRLGAFVVDFMEHFSDFAGAAIRLNGRWHGWSANLGYSAVICA
jgi:hypothetical protein